MEQLGLQLWENFISSGQIPKASFVSAEVPEYRISLGLVRYLLMRFYISLYSSCISYLLLISRPLGTMSYLKLLLNDDFWSWKHFTIILYIALMFWVPFLS